MDYNIEVFAEGSAIDGRTDTKYRITGKAFRAFGDAEADWYHAKRDIERGRFDTEQRYQDALKEAEESLKKFEADIARALGWDGKMFTVEHVVSEVFCAVLIEEVTA